MFPSGGRVGVFDGHEIEGKTGPSKTLTPPHALEVLVFNGNEAPERTLFAYTSEVFPIILPP